MNKLSIFRLKVLVMDILPVYPSNLGRSTINNADSAEFLNETWWTSHQDKLNYPLTYKGLISCGRNKSLKAPTTSDRVTN